MNNTLRISLALFLTQPLYADQLADIYNKAKETVKSTLSKKPIFIKTFEGTIIPLKASYFKFMHTVSDDVEKPNKNNSERNPFYLPMLEKTAKVLFDGFDHFAKGTLDAYIVNLSSEDLLRLVAGVRITNAMYVESAMRIILGQDLFIKYLEACHRRGAIQCSPGYFGHFMKN